MLCMALHIYACGVMKCSLKIIITENVNTSNGLDYISFPNQNSIKDIFQNNMHFCATPVQVTGNILLPTWNLDQAQT